MEDARNFYYTGHRHPSDATTRQRFRWVGTLPGSTASEFLGGFRDQGLKGLGLRVWPLGHLLKTAFKMIDQ